ncbi:MAG TPA: S8 family peptidase [Candidatus Limnocylindrales bacterium]|nr:S8 family peptidase [Candidatus Limnocylindrales bacterium]
MGTPKISLSAATALALLAGALLGGEPASSSAPASAPGTILYAGTATAVADSYLVVFPGNTTAEETTRRTGELNAKYGGSVRFTYTAALKGFAVQATAAQAASMAGDPLVSYVAQDQTVGLQDVQVQTGPPSWGIDRIDQRSLPLDNKYFYPNTAGNVRAFVIDTGLLLTHKEFGGRAFCGFDPWGEGCAPCNQGHATHVAGTLGGSTVGVAKGVRIVSVRVFQCTSSTTFAIVIAGIDYVTFAQQTTPSARSVANLSLGGGPFQPLDDAVTASIDANVHYSIAAGGSGTSACNFSPARVPRATTVAATDINDNRALFTNIGSCVDVFAPGTNIYSAWYTADNAYATLSGTSMSAPHAAGTAALWRQRFPADNADAVHDALNANATPGVVVNPGLGSPNKLLYMGMIPA